MSAFRHPWDVLNWFKYPPIKIHKIAPGDTAYRSYLVKIKNINGTNGLFFRLKLAWSIYKEFGLIVALGYGGKVKK